MTIQEVFEKFPITQAGFAERAGVNKTLLRGYSCGAVKSISEARLRDIEQKLHELGADLTEITLNR